MNKKYAHILFKCFFGILVLATITWQLMHSASQIAFSPGNFFGYFTIESNIFASIMFLVSALHLYNSEKSATLDYLRGAATVYMMVTGILFSLLLASLPGNPLVPWVSDLLHYVFPVVVLIDWLIDRPAFKMSFKRSLWWLSYPAVYAVYSLVRGHITFWYPYKFINAHLLGYGRIIINCLVIGLGITLLSFIVVKLSQYKRPVSKSKAT